MSEDDEIYCVSKEHELNIKDFLKRNCYEKDNKKRCFILFLLYSKKEKDLKEPIREYISDIEWESLIFYISQYVRFNLKKDYDNYIDYFNTFSQSKYPI